MTTAVAIDDLDRLYRLVAECRREMRVALDQAARESDAGRRLELFEAAGRLRVAIDEAAAILREDDEEWRRS